MIPKDEDIIIKVVTDNKKCEIDFIEIAWCHSQESKIVYSFKTDTLWRGFFKGTLQEYETKVTDDFMETPSKESKDMLHNLITLKYLKNLKELQNK